MKLLLILASLLTSLEAFSVNTNQNITCALSTKSVNGRVSEARAQKVVQLINVGENVYRLKRYRAHFFKKGYTPNSSGSGTVVELVNSQDGDYIIGSRLRLSADLASLRENRTTGGYPGSGRAPERLHNYICLNNYIEMISDVTREEVAQDFGL